MKRCPICLRLERVPIERQNTRGRGVVDDSELEALAIVAYVDGMLRAVSEAAQTIGVAAHPCQLHEERIRRMLERAEREHAGATVIAIHPDRAWRVLGLGRPPPPPALPSDEVLGTPPELVLPRVAWRVVERVLDVLENDGMLSERWDEHEQLRAAVRTVLRAEVFEQIEHLAPKKGS